MNTTSSSIQLQNTLKKIYATMTEKYAYIMLYFILLKYLKILFCGLYRLIALLNNNLRN